MSSKLKSLLKSKFSLDISSRQLSVFIKLYNDRQMPLHKRNLEILGNLEGFYNFIIDHPEVPLFGQVEFKKLTKEEHEKSRNPAYKYLIP